MKTLFVLVVISFVSLTFSCSKKKTEDLYTLEEFNLLAHESKAAFEKTDGLNISDYSPGVRTKDAQSLIYQRLIYYAVPFETEDQARAEAIRLNQYYARNWLFDRVEGEPILEDYVIKTFKAKNPNRTIQRVPKINEHTKGAHENIGAHH